MIENMKELVEKVFLEEDFKVSKNEKGFEDLMKEVDDYSKKRLKELSFKVNIEETYKEYNANYELIKQIQKLMVDFEEATMITIYDFYYDKGVITFNFDLQKKMYMYDKKINYLNYKKNMRNRFTIYEATFINENNKTTIEDLEYNLNHNIDRFIDKSRAIISFIDYDHKNFKDIK